MLTDKYYEEHKDIKITPVSKNDVIKKLKYDNTLLSNTVSEKDKEIQRLTDIIQKGYNGAVEQSIVDHKYASQKEDEAITYKAIIDKALAIVKKQEQKMYKSRNKIALYILVRLEKVLNGGK